MQEGKSFRARKLERLNRVIAEKKLGEKQNTEEKDKNLLPPVVLSQPPLEKKIKKIKANNEHRRELLKKINLPSQEKSVASNSNKLLEEIIGKMGESRSITLGNSEVLILAEDLHPVMGNVDSWYTSGFINLLIYQLFSASGRSLLAYPTIKLDEMDDEFNEKIRLQAEGHAFIPLCVSYANDGDHQHPNHWVALIVDKKHQQIFYLNPAPPKLAEGEAGVPVAVKKLQEYLNYKKEIILNPVNFQEAEQAEEHIRHCGVYVIEIFKVFFEVIEHGVYVVGDSSAQGDGLSLQGQLLRVPYKDKYFVHEVRERHRRNVWSFLEAPWPKSLAISPSVVPEAKQGVTLAKPLPEGVEKKPVPRPLTSLSPVKDETLKPLGQTLAEIVLGKDGGESKAPLTVEKISHYREVEKNPAQAFEVYAKEHQTDGEKLKLLRQYQAIKAYYQEEYGHYNQGQIKSWANAGAETGNIERFIAILDRANELLTKGHRLRDPQIFALLIFLNTEEGKGRLCQILTGEGKTTIVAMLAIIKACQGKAVDIITSNQVLAAEGVKDKQQLYEMFGLTVSTNNADQYEGYLKGEKACYKANVVYGCISNFQFDYLRDTFEGLDTRAKRAFNYALLDEVDSMLIDNGGHIAKLSGPLPGMEYFRHIYINIWVALCRLYEKNDGTDMANVSEKIKRMLIQQKAQFIDEGIVPGHLLAFARQSLDRWIENAVYAMYHCHEDKQYVLREKEGEKVVVPVDYSNTGVTLKDTIWSYGLHQFVQLKHHLYLSSENLTSSFISNLGYINKYDNHIYGLTGTLGSITEQELLSEIYHVDYAKIPAFKDKRFEEKPGEWYNDEEWLSKVVMEIVQTVREQRAVLVIAETIWDAKQIEEVLKAVQDKISSAHNVKVHLYLDEEISKATEQPVDIGEIVISTNIAGRGTDLGTTKALEEKGGMHVCVGFLPKNKRVEEQAFGRTARQGKRGSAKMIFRSSEVPTPLASESRVEDVTAWRDSEEKRRLQEIKSKKIQALKFEDKIFSLFSLQYSGFKKALTDNSSTAYLCYHLCSDLKEWWAFFLESLSEDDKKTNAEEKFNQFLQSEKTQKILHQKMIAHNPYYGIQLAEHLIRNGKLDEAEKHLANASKIAGANSELLYPLYLKRFEIEIEKGNVVVERLKLALGKIFLLPVKKNNAYKENARAALQQAKKGIEKEIGQLKQSLEKLFQSTERLSEPSTEKNVAPRQRSLGFERREVERKPGEKDSEKLAASTPAPSSANADKNLLFTHLYGRQLGLEIFLNNIEDLLGQVEGKEPKGKLEFQASAEEEQSEEENPNNYANAAHDLQRGQHLLQQVRKNPKDNSAADNFINQLCSEKKIEKALAEKIKESSSRREKEKEESLGEMEKAGLMIALRKGDYFDTLDDRQNDQKVLKDYVSKKEISELSFIGLENIYQLKKVHDVHEKAIFIAQAEMHIGIRLFAAAVASAVLAPVAKMLDTMAGLFISESISGILSEILNGGEEFDEAVYWKNKAISYGISAGLALLGGIWAMANTLHFVQKVKIEFLKKISHHFKIFSFSEKLSKPISKLPSPFLPHLMKKIGTIAVNIAVNTVINKVLVDPVFEQMFESLKPTITQEIKKLLADKLPDSVFTHDEEEIYAASENIIEKEDTSAQTIAVKIAQGIVIQKLKDLNTKHAKINIVGKAIGMATEDIISLKNEIIPYVNAYCEALNKALTDQPSGQKSKSTTNRDEIIALLAEQVSRKMYDLISGIVRRKLPEFSVEDLNKKLKKPQVSIEASANKKLPPHAESLSKGNDKKLGSDTPKYPLVYAQQRAATNFQKFNEQTEERSLDRTRINEAHPVREDRSANYNRENPLNGRLGRSYSINDRAGLHRPTLFPEGKAWDNVPPIEKSTSKRRKDKATSSEAPKEVSKKPKGESKSLETPFFLSPGHKSPPASSSAQTPEPEMTPSSMIEYPRGESTRKTKIEKIANDPTKYNLVPSANPAHPEGLILKNPHLERAKDFSWHPHIKKEMQPLSGFNRNHELPYAAILKKERTNLRHKDLNEIINVAESATKKEFKYKEHKEIIDKSLEEIKREHAKPTPDKDKIIKAVKKISHACAKDRYNAPDNLYLGEGATNKKDGSNMFWQYENISQTFKEVKSKMRDKEAITLSTKQILENLKSGKVTDVTHKYRYYLNSVFEENKRYNERQGKNNINKKPTTIAELKSQMETYRENAIDSKEPEKKKKLLKELEEIYPKIQLIKYL